MGRCIFIRCNMLGILSELEIEEFLKSELVGRIGCHSDGVTYVVPVNYIYDGVHIYAHSGQGMKINMMRKDPNICFEIDNIQSIIHWRSVIVWGKFEEITDLHEKQEIMQKLISIFVSTMAS